MKNMGRSALRLTPMKWIGVVLPYQQDGKLYEAFAKNELIVRAWDSVQKTWWIPESSWIWARAVLQAHNAATDLELTVIDKGLARAQPVFSGTSGHYAALGLQENAPEGLVKLAYEFWKKEFKYAPGIPLQLENIEAAYQAIQSNL